MKTNETMMITLIGVVLCSFFFGLGQHELTAQVQNCVVSCCEATYAWWSGGAPGNGKACASAQTTGATFPFAPGQNTAQAIPNLAVPAQTPGGCALQNVGNYDQWGWPDNLATCQNSDGTYPNPQGVTPKGTPSLNNAGSTLNECALQHNP